MNAQPAISVHALSKRYRIQVGEARPQTLRQAVQRTAAAPFRYLKYKLRAASHEEIFWALKDISFEVGRGEVLGIIGRNGAGKSTLLKILSRITDPTDGTAVIRGHVNSLLEVGTGFHQELTGRENIHMNAALHGMRRAEIARKLDEIIAFAEIERFIDTPVKRYSSGMYTRLAFAVAAHLEPDIMIVDEVLAVGDVAFQNKCMGKMGEVAHAGRTVLFVSHNMNAVNRLCTRCILLKQGVISAEGRPADVVSRYLDYEGGRSRSQVTFAEDPEKSWQWLSAALCRPDGRVVDTKIEIQEPYMVEAELVLRRRLHSGYAVLFVRNDLGETIFLSDNRDCPDSVQLEEPGRRRIRIAIPAPLLVHGTYHVTLSLAQEPSGTVDQRDDALNFDISDVKGHRPSVQRPGFVYCPLVWSDRTSPPART